MRRLLMVTVLLTGCVHVSKTVLMDRSGMPVPKESVYVYLANDTIPASCERVAILHGSGAQDWTDESDMIDELRLEAGKLGANAIHLLSMEDAGTGEMIVAALFDTEADRDSDALALWCPDGLQALDRDRSSR